MTGTKAPVVFIHGLWLHASSWQPWQELFAEARYHPSAPGWPGDAHTVQATRANRDSTADVTAGGRRVTAPQRAVPSHL
jgi:non-heme chloroperoxidase